MNRNELIGYLAAEIVKVLPEEEKELDGDDLETVEDCVEEVLKNAEEAIDESGEEEDDEEEKTTS